MRITLFLMLLAGAAACRDARSADGQRRAPGGLPPMDKSAVPAATAPAPAPAGHGAAAAPAAAPEAGGTVLSGEVKERIDAPPYSYLRVATPQGERWAAVNQTDVAVGKTVTVSGAVMQGFESKTLKRRFDEIVFGTLAGEVAQAAPKPALPVHGQGEGEPPAETGRPHTSSPVATGLQVPIAEGPGATTIARLYAGKAGLADKPIAVRGKVVKLNKGIMGKTWLHVQDGSGSPEAGDHDLAVTTTDDVKLDDVVTVRGALHLDRDFGAGYAYAVIVEDAKIQP